MEPFSSWRRSSSSSASKERWSLTWLKSAGKRCPFPPIEPALLGDGLKDWLLRSLCVSWTTFAGKELLAKPLTGFFWRLQPGICSVCFFLFGPSSWQFHLQCSPLLTTGICLLTLPLQPRQLARGQWTSQSLTCTGLAFGFRVLKACSLHDGFKLSRSPMGWTPSFAWMLGFLALPWFQRCISYPMPAGGCDGKQNAHHGVLTPWVKAFSFRRISSANLAE